MEKQEERVTGEDTGGRKDLRPPPEISKQKMFPILIALYNVYGRPFFESYLILFNELFLY